MPKTLPRPAADVAKVLNTICSRRPRKDLPLDCLRDRVLFETIYVCAARAAGVCGLDIEDFDLRQADQHVRIHGKGARWSATTSARGMNCSAGGCGTWG